MAHKLTPNQKLEAARLKKRWSVDLASKKIGVSVNTFNRWERGLQLPQLETLDQLCKAFDMLPDELGFENVIVAKRRTRKFDQSQLLELSTVSPPIEKRQAFVNDQEREFFIHANEPEFTPDILKKSLDEPSLFQENRERRGKTRKQAIALLVSTPSVVFDMTQGSSRNPLYPEETLLLSAVNVPLCWQLYYEGGFAELRSILPGYLLQLSALAQQTSHYQKKAAHLASQTHQLSYLLALQNQDFGTSLNHTRESLHYGQLAEDTNLQGVSVVQKAYIYFCLHRTGQRLQTYQEALYYCNTCSPLLRGYVYAGLAETYASCQDEAHAHEFLQLAHKYYPEHPEEDPIYPYTHFRWSTFYNFAGQVYLHLNQPEKAWEAFATVEHLVPVCEEPYRVELSVYQTATAVALGNLEQSCSLLTSTIRSARALGSELHYNEICNVYTRMQMRWRNEPRVKALEELFNC